MPPINVYGKRTHVYANATIFNSPRKSKAQVDVLELTDELDKLRVIETKCVPENEVVLERPVLGDRSANRQTRTFKRSRKVVQKEDVSNEKQAPVVVEAITPKKSKDMVKKKHVTNERQPAVVVEDDTPRVMEKVTRKVDVTNERQPPVVVEASTPQVLNQPETLEKDQIEVSVEGLALSESRGALVTTEIIRDITQTVEERIHRVPDVYEQHTADLLALSTRPLTSFSEWSDQLSSHFDISKIAEASFGEVYRLSLFKSHTKHSRTDESVLKIIALKPPKATLKGKKLSKAAKERFENMSNPADVFSEVRLLQRMTHIPGFTNFRDITVLRGRPGNGFVSAWHSWNDRQRSLEKDLSVFPDPAKKASYGPDQLWAIVEMQDAGSDLEHTTVTSIFSAWDIFWNVVLSLGKGEEGARFEHRDLHLGNICVSSPHGRDLSPIDESQIDISKKLGFTDVETTIIDYTLSRAEMGAPTSETEEADIAFMDLDTDEAIFTGNGEEEYQYDIYRHMRAAMYLDDPLADIYERWDEATASGRTWRGYHPQTNLVWLHFVLYRVLGWVEWPSEMEAPEDKARHARALELEVALSRVSELLGPGDMPGSGLRSAADLVALALQEKWLDVRDVVGSGGSKKSRKQKCRRTRRQK